MERQNKVQWIYSSANNNELSSRYDEWASDYETDLANDFEWNGHVRAVESLLPYINSDSLILDAGAGTGLVGLLLNQAGCTNLVAMDLSTGMLEQASKKQVYAELHQMVMGERLEFPSDHFDATITVGVLTIGHAPPTSLDELVRVTKPGGYIAFSLRSDIYEPDGFKAKQDSLSSAQKWELVECTDAFKALPKGEPDAYHQIWVYRVL
tara:strand:- start:8313 stop:8939 length:627 start_codon:yes stop_codon:yes gene_type:complete